ncbi:MAG: histidinol-phosphate transaminase [Thermofilaceae archaeon]
MSSRSAREVYRLSLNENLFLPRELVSGVVKKAADLVDPRFYSQPLGEELAERLAEFHGVEPSEIVVGAGADHLIYLTAHYGRERGAAIVEPTFEEYARALKLSGAPYVGVRLSEDFQLDLDELQRVEAGLLYLASPNNPTANQFDREAVLEAARRFRVVVLDEAYAEYARYTMIREAPSRDNLIVVRTFSKAWGLAGLRVGYAVANRSLASQLRERGPVYACSSLSLKAAELMLDHWGEVRRAVEELKSVREWMREKLSELPVKVYPSDTNFLLVRLPADSARVREALLEKGFSVKDVGHAPLLANCIRVTVPPKPVAEAFIEALREVLEGM